MSWIYSSLNEDKLGEIIGCSSAYEIWEHLRIVYESSSTAMIMGLRSQLQKIRKDGLSVSQYLAQIKDIADKFSAIGEPLSYRDHLGYILEGLDKYNPFVTSIQNRTDCPSLANVRSLLIAYEVRLEKQTSVDSLNLVQANFANLSMGNNAKRFQKSPNTSKPAPTSKPPQGLFFPINSLVISLVPAFLVVPNSPPVLPNGSPTLNDVHNVKSVESLAIPP